MNPLFKILTEVVAEQPETVGVLTEVLNNTLTWVISLGGAGVLAVSNIMTKVLPSKDFKSETWKKINGIESLINQEGVKLAELEEAQREYQKANDELLMEIAKHSPNAKVKELGKQLDEKKKQLNLQEQIQEKVNSAVKTVEAKAVSILKKKE